jgi:hypothetical protein
MEWRHPSSPRKKFKADGRVLVTIVWNSSDVLLLDFLVHGHTVNADRYCSMLKSMREAIR